MNIENVRRSVTVQYSADGADQFAQKSRDVGKAHSEMATAVKSSTNVVSEQEVAMARMQRQMDIMAQSTKQVTAANDNAARSSAGVISGTQEMGRSFVSTSESILNAVGHLKLLALGAYALFPALRSVVNSGAAEAFALLGPAAGVARTAIAGVATALSPAFSFLARIGAPIAAVVVAWQALNSVISTGSGLLEKYGNSERSLFDDSNINANIEKLTKFQNDTISLQQVQYATQLGVRLDEAKQKISDFLKVQIDVTNVALKLQNIWVVIVETIAKVADKLSYLISLIPNLTKILGAVPGINLPILAARGLNSIAGPAEPSADEAMALARSRLAAGMGGGFAGRFNGDIKALADPPKPEAPTPAVIDAWTRYVDQQNKANAAVEASIKTVGLATGAHEAMKVQLEGESILQRAGITNDEERQETLAKLAKRAGDTWAALEKIKVDNQISFDRQTMFLSSADVQIAQQLKGLYGNDIPAALNSSEAAAMRVNIALKDMKTNANDFGQSLIQALASGKTGAEALSAALNTVASKLASKAMDAGISGMLGGAASMFGGGMTAYGGGGAMDQGPVQGGGAAAGGAVGGLGGLLGMSGMAGPAAPLMMAAGIGISLIQGAMAKRTQEAAQRAADMLASQQRADSYAMAAQLAGIDTTTISGALKAFDIQGAHSLLNESMQKYPQMAALEAQLAAQRLTIIKQFNDQVIAESKKVLDYVQGLQTGSLSTLSPQAQLALLQSTFSTHLTAAQGGDQTALSGITQDADALLNAAKSFFASSAGYGAIFNTVSSQLTSLGNHPALYDSAGNIQRATGFVSGGLIGNGLYGVDSVRARFAGGGDIMLAGGEFVNRAQSVNVSTFPTLDHINRTGSLPSSGNSGAQVILLSDIRKAITDGTRTNAVGYQNQTDRQTEEAKELRAEIAQLRGEIKSLANVRRMPGGPH